MNQRTFHIEVGDAADLTIDELWPDGNAPENPTVDDVIVLLKEQGPSRVRGDWGFEFHAHVNGKAAF